MNKQTILSRAIAAQRQLAAVRESLRKINPADLRSATQEETNDMNPIINIETITPEIAQQMLRHNHKNRRLSKEHVKMLAAEMTADRWRLNGSTICFNGNTLVDGQHRLQAVIVSGVAISTLVVRNLEDDVFDTIDTGRKRSGADTLTTDGEVNCNLLAASLRIITAYDNRTLPVAPYLFNYEVRDALARYPDARESTRWASNSSNKSRLLPPTWWAVAHFIFSRLDADDAQHFLSSLVTGAALEAGSPIHILRKRLEDNMTAKTKYPAAHLLAFTIKAWNAQRTRKPIKALKFRFDNNNQEDFPIAI